MSGMVEVIRKIVRDEMSKRYTAELGVVTSIFPHSGDSDKDNYECNVQLKYRDLELRKVPVATQHIGLTNVPKVGDLVLLNFINGDINSPIIAGRLYTDEERPPVNQGEEIIYKPPYSKNPDLRRLQVELPSGMKVTITDDLVDVKASGTEFKINRGGDVLVHSSAAMKITAAGDMEITAKNLKIKTDETLKVESTKTTEIKSMEDFTLTGGKNVGFTVTDNMKMDVGSNYELNAGIDGNMNIGSQMNLKAGALGTIEAAASMTIKGGVVQINP
jgi:phage baseplate assembly protein gpV